jgi:predicted nucleic acid-binding protein
VIVDTSALLAYFNDREREHSAVTATIDQANEPLIVSPFVVAELDYMVLTRGGVAAELIVLRALYDGAWEIAYLSPEDLRRAVQLIADYADEQIGLADASNMILAQRYATTTIATLDRRHFAVLKLPDGRVLDVVP